MDNIIHSFILNLLLNYTLTINNTFIFFNIDKISLKEYEK